MSGYWYPVFPMVFIALLMMIPCAAETHGIVSLSVELALVMRSFLPSKLGPVVEQ